MIVGNSGHGTCNGGCDIKNSLVKCLIMNLQIIINYA
jgi:hypothetical protein